LREVEVSSRQDDPKGRALGVGPSVVLGVRLQDGSGTEQLDGTVDRSPWGTQRQRTWYPAESAVDDPEQGTEWVFVGLKADERIGSGGEVETCRTEGRKGRGTGR
jgi:hypothetical protein